MNAADTAAEPMHVYRLYVSGSTPRSLHAIANAKRMLDKNLPNNYKLEVVDLYQCHDAMEDGIVATPTLMRIKPAPSIRFVGNAIGHGLF